MLLLTEAPTGLELSAINRERAAVGSESYRPGQSPTQQRQTISQRKHPSRRKPDSLLGLSIFKECICIKDRMQARHGISHL